VNAISTAAILALLAISVYALNKLRHVHLLLFTIQSQMRQEMEQLYQQFAALHALQLDLGLTKSLPPTRGWAASPDFLLELSRHAQAAKPATVVECSSGTSTVVLARCMQLNGGGKVYSLEHDAAYAKKTREQLARHGLSAFADVLVAELKPQRFGGAERIWYDFSVLPAGLSIDMLVVDGPPDSTAKQARYPAGAALFPRLAPGAAVFLDDAHRPDETAIVAQWKREFPELKASVRYCEKGCAVLQTSAAA
jgi:predicted O-methyltransferase YrrM